MILAGFDEIVGFTPPEHTASRRMMQKLGMEYIGDREHQGETDSFYQFKKENFGIDVGD